MFKARAARISSILAIVQLLVGTRVALGSPPTPLREDIGARLRPRVEGATAACRLQSGPEAVFSYGFTAPNYFAAFAWRIPRQSCAACLAPNVLNIRNASITLAWGSLPCMAHLHVSVVAARGDPACPTPDTTRVLCPAFGFTAVSGVEEYETYAIPFPADCCVSEDAFVLIRFEDLDACRNGTFGGSFIVATNLLCANCEEYVIVANSDPGFADWCALLGGPDDHSLWIQLDADCCATTPTRPRSWGTIKTLYR